MHGKVKLDSKSEQYKEFYRKFSYWKQKMQVMTSLMNDKNIFGGR